MGVLPNEAGRAEKTSPKAESGDGVVGEGAAPTAQRFPLFSAFRMASSDTRILLIVDHKKKKKETNLIPFNLESIIVHLVMLCGVFNI